MFCILYLFSFGQESTATLLSYVGNETPNSSSLLNPNSALFTVNEWEEIFKLNHTLRYTQFTIDWQVSSQSTEFKKSDFKMTLREMFYDVSLTDQLDLSIGRKLFKEGSGYYKNPAAYLNVKKQAGDISDRLKSNEGRDIIGLNYFFDSSDLQIVYSPNYTIEQWKTDIKSHDITAKYYFLKWDTDISFVYNYRSTLSDRFGVILANTVSDALEVHAEASVQYGTEKTYHKNIDPSKPHQVYQTLPYATEREDRWISQVLFGLNYTSSFGLNIIAEYSYDGDGLSKSEWNNLVHYTNYLLKLSTQPMTDIAREGVYNNIKWVAYSLNQQKEYLFVRAAQPIKDIELSAISIHNLYDGSAVLIGQLDYSIFGINTVFQSMWFTGKQTSDYGTLFSDHELSLQIAYHF